MLKVSINYHFNGSDYPLLKEAAALYLSEIPPAQRLELLARWCGFSTLVLFRTALSSKTVEDIYLVLDAVAARTFAEGRGISLDASACHHALASAAFARLQESTHVPDLRQLADAFRKWCAGKSIKLDASSIEKTFTTWCKSHSAR